MSARQGFTKRQILRLLTLALWLERSYGLHANGFGISWQSDRGDTNLQP